MSEHFGARHAACVSTPEAAAPAGVASARDAIGGPLAARTPGDVI
ncbi:hypothetical protein RND61_28180 [Streptomyces sp. TRM76323]|uniref:Uncharacterized protein n=1 Tax=Streptomyces tamarix TaxID=3078565 RepID=A0ABU3QT26_9ACTN|nr:hypothetical protein [Streptomyces tamarix]MDT9685917.1 hypothetical protein [Streptomyces tamarix]